MELEELAERINNWKIRQSGGEVPVMRHVPEMAPPSLAMPAVPDAAVEDEMVVDDMAIESEQVVEASTPTRGEGTAELVLDDVEEVR